ncbi:MAG: YceI family protein [Acidobacteriota bacterium]
MKSRLPILLAVALIATAVGGPVIEAEPIVRRLDPEQTKVAFTLGATLHQVEGTFRLLRGEITFDPASGEASGEIVLDIASGDTGNAKRDRKMHRDILESERFPTATFVAESFAGNYPGSGTLQGRLTFHGDEHSFEIIFEHVDEGPGEGNVRGSFRIPFVAWGLEDPSTFVLRVEKEVEVTFETLDRAP